MTAEQLKAAGAIYFENVVEGMKAYSNRIVRMSMDQAVDKFTALWKSAGYTNVYVDFYYFRLTSEEREKVNEILTLQEREYVEKLTHEEGQVLFPADESLLRICAKLNAAQMLFSTVYVTGEQKSTWWGNYGQEYIVFTEKEKER